MDRYIHIFGGPAEPTIEYGNIFINDGEWVTVMGPTWEAAKALSNELIEAVDLSEHTRNRIALWLIENGYDNVSKGRIEAALDEMDGSMYGDPEVPFRMRAELTGKEYR